MHTQSKAQAEKRPAKTLSLHTKLTPGTKPTKFKKKKNRKQQSKASKC